MYQSSITITIDDHSYTLNELRTWSPQTGADRLSDQAGATLEFCHQWLHGQEEFVVHTSGSTGNPRPFTLHRNQMIASAYSTGQALGLQAGQWALVCLPTRYIAGRMMLVRGMVLGLAMTVVEPSSHPLANLPPDARFDFTALVPLQLETILAGSPEGLDMLNRMQSILVGGGPVSASLEARLQAITAPIYHTYGMTETVSHIALRRLNGAQRSDRFLPLPGVTLGQDTRGCLTIQAPMTRDEVLVTNDLVERFPDSSFRWTGRHDNIINSGGVKIQLEQVEQALTAVLTSLEGGSLSTRDFFVGPLPDARLGQVVTLVMEGTTLDAATETAIQGALQSYLNRYAIPRRFCYLPRLQRTPTGKIDRLANLRLLE